MQAATRGETTKTVPKRRKRHYSYNENVDEPAKLIEDQPVEIEEGIPAEENEPIERIEQNNNSGTPAFDE